MIAPRRQAHPCTFWKCAAASDLIGWERLGHAQGSVHTILMRAGQVVGAALLSSSRAAGVTAADEARISSASAESPESVEAIRARVKSDLQWLPCKGGLPDENLRKR